MLKLSIRTQRQFSSTTSKYKNYASTVTGGAGLGQPQTLKVSTTRGTPSTSTDLKEALCEKIPLHHDLLRKFRLRHGASIVSNITVDDLYQGLSGISTTVRETSEIDPKFGVKYRGLTIPEVVALLPRRGNSPCPEAVFWLLLTGDVPTNEQTASLIADWTSRREKKKEWWSEKGGGIVGAVLETLPKTVSPLRRLCIALTTLGADEHMQKALKSGAMTHTHWEYVYEDCMEVLAVLPAIVGLVSKTQELNNVTEGGDWVDFLLDCLGNISASEKGKKSSLGEFLRLYITVNADEDNGSPGAHTTQIIGDSTLDPSQALAAGVLAYADEPKGGSMVQYIEFQTKLQHALGCEPSETAIKNYLELIVERDAGQAGYKESEFCDPRYIVLRNYARENLSEAPEIKFYGLRDMEFNQILLCMSRALGAIASMIWARAINAPVERPKSRSTYTYMDTISKVHKKYKKYPVTYVKRSSK